MSLESLLYYFNFLLFVILTINSFASLYVSYKLYTYTVKNNCLWKKQIVDDLK